MRSLYSALYYCLVPFIVLRMLWRSRRSPEYRRRLAERFGFFAADPEGQGRPVIWVHAVSVGETLAAVPLVESLLQDYPDHRLVITTTTPTGSERVRSIFGERVFHVYCPWDLPGAVRRFLARIRPRLLLIMETELWPNMLHLSRAGGCRTLLTNARMSARSARGYARLGPLTRQMLGNLDAVACQSQADGERLLALGLPAPVLHITGSIKFDLELDAMLRASAAELRRSCAVNGREVLVAASTHPGEDEQVLTAFARVRERHADCLLVLVPRHPERFDDVYRLCVAADWRVARRSTDGLPGADDDILLGDTMGELVAMLGAASVAVIGGSLVPHGGHNALEAAAWQVPVVTGPHMFNFAEISELLVAAGGMLMLADPADLGQALVELLGDADRRRRMGEAGLQVVEQNRGAQQRLLALVAHTLQQ